MQKPCVRAERLLRSVKQSKESDGVTIWQVNKTHRRQSGHEGWGRLHSLRPVIRTAFSRSFWGQWSGPILSLLRPAIRTAFSRSFWDRWSGPNCRRQVLFTCQIVTPSLSLGCFTERSNLSTRTRRFCMPVYGAGGPGGCNHVEMIGLETGILSWKFQPIWSTFSPSKSHFSVLFGMAPPPGGLHLSILAPIWAALTLTLCTQHCVPVSHLHVPHQNSTSTCFSTVFQVSSCLTHLLTARTVRRFRKGQSVAPFFSFQ